MGSDDKTGGRMRICCSGYNLYMFGRQGIIRVNGDLNKTRPDTTLLNSVLKFIFKFFVVL